MTLSVVLLTGVAGGFGALARFVVDGAVTRALARPFPLGTMVVNLTASVLLGIAVGVGTSTPAQTVVGVGVLGGYSTFSTWMLETARLGAEGRGWAALANVVVSVLGGVLGVVAGRGLGL